MRTNYMMRKAFWLMTKILIAAGIIFYLVYASTLMTNPGTWVILGLIIGFIAFSVAVTILGVFSANRQAEKYRKK